ncbi:uncharacterized protein LOC123317447 [Coccinella septempunctata]|uniref:uncharacterized protein LOC123317447 n=1 Tax=Coccinella septempunctata TaxID=41139 RepID=UPI001D07E7C4|nr:uncharacterized protein LOC123317447 [Coccinella septempunctata]
MNLKNFIIVILALISLSTIKMRNNSASADPPKLEYPETYWHFAGRDWKKHHKLVHTFQWPQIFDHFIDPLIPKKVPPTRRKKNFSDFLADLGDNILDILG